MEGNTLTRLETATIIDKDLTVAGKSLTEHIEAVNHARAVDYIWHLSQERLEITIDTILEIHRLVLSSIDDVNAGRFRTVSVRAVGSKTVFPNSAKVRDKVKLLVNYINTSQDQACLLAAKAHLDLVSIHPFVDGNGRSGRLLMNLLLLRAGYPASHYLQTKPPALFAAVGSSSSCQPGRPFLEVYIKSN